MPKRILIADDDEYLRQALEQLLELEGYTITGAPNARAALGLAQQTACDLILLDARMPGAGGLDALAALHDLLPRVPIIMMSGQAGDNLVSDALQGGAFDFIMKPFDVDLVLTAVKRALELPGAET